LSTAQPHSKSSDFRQPARYQGRARAIPETQPIGDSGSDGDHILGGATELDANHIVARVNAKARAVQLPRHHLGKVTVVAG
jgi:hypothetical protein